MNELQHFERRLKSEINISDYHDAYNIETAMQAVAIIFQENNGFQKCTPESKYKAVLSMVCQGLNPLKGQCSFVPYGNQLQLLRDYSGSIMVAKRENKRIDAIHSKVVREGDDFVMDIVNGCYIFSRHRPTIESLSGRIIAAYAVAVDKDGKVIDADIMSYEDIKNTWKNAQLKYKGEPVVRHDDSLHPGSNHAKYPEKMTTKTVIHRLCRSIIKQSGNETIAETADLDDEYVVQEAEVGDTKPQILDFSPRKEQMEAATEPMATREQADKIVELARLQGIEKNIFEEISKFVGRQIEKIRYLTQTEAERYILKLEGPHDNSVPWKT